MGEETILITVSVFDDRSVLCLSVTGRNGENILTAPITDWNQVLQLIGSAAWTQVRICVTDRRPRVPYVETDHVAEYGMVSRLSRALRVF